MVPDSSDPFQYLDEVIGTQSEPGDVHPPAEPPPSPVAPRRPPRIAALIDELYADPSVRQIRLDDPRFRWVSTKITGYREPFESIEVLISHLLTDERQSDYQLTDLLDHLLAYTDDQRNLPLEDELFAIVAAALGADKVAPLLMRYGWHGGPPSTLAAAAERAGVSRERIRQIQEHLETQFFHRPVWTPALDRALALATAHAPIEQGAFDLLLRQEGLSAFDAFDMDGLVNALTVLQRETSLTVQDVYGVRLLVQTDQRETNEGVELVQAIRTATLKRVSNQGITSVDEVIAYLASEGLPVTADLVRTVIPPLDDHELLDGDWIVTTAHTKSNALLYRLRKILSQHPGVPVEVAVAQIARDRRRSYPASAAAIRAFATFHPDLELDTATDTIHATSAIRPEEALSEGELLVRSFFLTTGPKLRFDQLMDLASRHNLKRVTATVILAGSPVIQKPARNQYVLLEPSNLPSTHEFKLPAPDDGEERGTASLIPALEPAQALPQNDAPVPAVMTTERKCMGNLETTMMPVAGLVDMVANQSLQLPEIQRAYVWNRPQVRDLLDSLYRGYPIGTMLIWQTDETPLAKPIGHGQPSSGLNGVRFLLDGQQRLTSLERVFHRQESSPDIRFNVETEEFQVSNAAIAKDPAWVSVTDVFERGAIDVLWESPLRERSDAKAVSYRLNRLEHIRKHTVPVNVLSGFGYEEVTEIFVRVNSKGTRLRVAELAIAQLAFRLPGLVTNELKAFEEELEDAGWDIDLPFLLRCLTAVSTGQGQFAALSTVPDGDLAGHWKRTRRAMEGVLNLLDKNLGIRSMAWLPSTTALVLPVAYLARTDAKSVAVNDLLRWFLLASTWSRYASASETALNQDLRTLHGDQADPFPALVARIVQASGRLHVEPNDLDDAGTGSPFFLMAYLACRQQGAVDWWTGTMLSSTNLGNANLLELHHIFPKAIVNQIHSRRDVNEIANLAFLSQQANRQIGKQEPTVYLPSVDEERLRRQFIPLDQALWQKERFQDFLAERRQLLATGMNGVFQGLEDASSRRGMEGVESESGDP